MAILTQLKKSLLLHSIFILGVLTTVSAPTLAYADRIKDIATIAGVRSNQLFGYGLVVGLNGSGDKTNQAPFTNQSFKSMLREFGIRVPTNLNFQLKNVAAVAISASLPPFIKLGQTIDITVSSIGNSSSLRGGTLLFSTLRGADGKVYAVAQGSVIVGGIGASGRDGSKITVNVPSTGTIPNGATVERTVPTPYDQGGSLVFNLRQPDFTTANRMVNTINRFSRQQIAHAIDAASIRVDLPVGGKFRNGSNRIAFISRLENLMVKPAEGAAKIVVNSRTGTIVIGKHVQVLPAAVAHGNLTVTITESPQVSQPEPLSEGETVVVPDSDVQIAQEKTRAFVFAPGTSLNDIVRAINRVGAAPGDLMAILEALKAVGALRAELVVI